MNGSGNPFEIFRSLAEVAHVHHWLTKIGHLSDLAGYALPRVKPPLPLNFPPDHAKSCYQQVEDRVSAARMMAYFCQENPPSHLHANPETALEKVKDILLAQTTGDSVPPAVLRKSLEIPDPIMVSQELSSVLFYLSALSDKIEYAIEEEWGCRRDGFCLIQDRSSTEFALYRGAEDAVENQGLTTFSLGRLWLHSHPGVHALPSPPDLRTASDHWWNDSNHFELIFSHPYNASLLSGS